METMSKKHSPPAKKENPMTGLFIITAVLALALLGLVVGFMSNADNTDEAASSDNDSAVAVAALDSLPPVIDADTYQATFIQGGADHYLLDVRTIEEFESGHIAGAANISHTDVAARLAEIPKDKPVVVYCRSGNRSAQAAQVLRDAGYTQVYDLGGIIAWQEDGYTLCTTC
jgi:rhodanese-related sulfurtransferase